MEQGNIGTGKDFVILVEEEWVLLSVLPDTVITCDLILQMLAELYAMDAYRMEKRAGLWDFRGCGVDMDFSRMESIKRYIEANYDPNWSHTHTAMVADGELAFGLSRMYQIMTDNVPTVTKVFREMDSARRWLLESLS